MKRQRTTVVRSYDSALKWAKWDVWVNGGITIGYVLWCGWQVNQSVARGGLWWINVVICLAFTLWFSRVTRKAFRRYVELKERGHG
jgi:hypothetical protein